MVSVYPVSYTHLWEASYDANYPLKDYLDQAGLQYVDVIMGWNAKGEPVM